MATATLDDIVESNLLGAEKLEAIEQQFDMFFKQSAADKLDMLELMRELRGGDPTTEPEPTDVPQPTPEETGGGIASFLGLSGLLGLLGAIQLNAVGATGSLKGLRDKIKELPESLKNAGKAIGEFAGKARDSIVEKFNSVKEKLVTKITESKTFQQAKDLGSKAKEFVSGGIEKAKDLASGLTERASGLFERAKSFASEKASALASGAKDTFQKVKAFGAEKVASAKETAVRLGETAKAGFTKFQQSKVGQGLGKATKVAGRVLAPLAVVTSGYEGFKMATEEASKELGTAGQIAVGTAGAASAFFGGLGDFVKLVTVDAPTELANRLGIVSDETADKIQDFSIQRDVTDALVRGARDGIRSAMSEGIEKQTMQRVAENAQRPVIVNNVTDASTNVSNATAVTGANSAPPTPVNNNGTFSDAWAGA